MDSQRRFPRQKLPELHVIKNAASGRWAEILTTLTSLSAEALTGKKCPCLRCGGTDRFRVFDDFAIQGGVICSHCHSKRCADGLATICWANGVELRDAIKLVAVHLGLMPADDPSGASAAGAVTTRKVVPAPKPQPPKAQPPRATQPIAQPAPIAATTHPAPEAERPHPAKDLTFLEWNPSLVEMWCQKKQPITPEAIQRIGGRLARYQSSIPCIALPIYGVQLADAEPVGWVIYHLMGGQLPSKDGLVTKKVTFGSQAGVLGLVGRLRDKSTRRIKTEGPTDTLAMISVNPESTDCVFCNAYGADEHPEKNLSWLASLVEKTNCVTIHDADAAGERGAARWANFFAATAADSRVTKLPFEVTESKGRDLRDWLREGHTATEFDALAAAAEPVTHSTPKLDIDVIEQIDDPHRLARLNLKFYKDEYGGDLKYWRDEWMRWKNNRYKMMSSSEFEGKVNKRIKAEFDRHWYEEYQEYQEWRKSAEFDPDEDKGPPFAKKVTASILRDTLKAMQSQCLMSGDIELGTWIDGREKRKYLACNNGILDIQAFIDQQPGKDYFLKHSSNWFSTACLEYDFREDADCPKWLKYLEEVTEGNEEKIRLLQEFVGYILSPENNRSKFLALEGDGGNGKSVFVNGVQAIIGSANMSSVSLTRMGERFGTFSTLGKMLNVCHESSDLESPAESALKQFTGGDPMSFEQKGKDPFETKPTAKLMITWNEPPRFKDKTDALWRRLLVVRFERRIQNPNTQLLDPEYWVKTGEVSGMLNWALHGLARLEKRGFTVSTDMNDRIEGLRTANNSARNFIKEFYTYEDDKAVACKTIFEKYTKWALAGNYKPVNEVHFGREINGLFKTMVERRRRLVDDFDGRVWCYVNLRERTDYDDDDSSDPYTSQGNRVSVEARS